MLAAFLRLARRVEATQVPQSPSNKEMFYLNIGAGEQFEPGFLKIAPNSNRMPAIVDPDGPDGKPISMFESGAILQYPGARPGQFYPGDERGRARLPYRYDWSIG